MINELEIKRDCKSVIKSRNIKHSDWAAQAGDLQAVFEIALFHPRGAKVIDEKTGISRNHSSKGSI